LTYAFSALFWSHQKGVKQMTARAEIVQDIVQLAWIRVARLSWLNPQEVKTHRLALVEMQENLAQILEDLEEREQ
jgi:hypothetical protein